MDAAGRSGTSEAAVEVAKARGAGPRVHARGAVISDCGLYRYVAALYVDPRGPYPRMGGVDCWDVRRDARGYAGPWPVVAHPPCERWGRYWHGGPSARVRRAKGDDDSCFAAALSAVRRWGGVLEHPEASHAFAAHGLARPVMGAGWQRTACGGAVCQVEQGHYGHPARKKTWLYAVGTSLPELPWGQAPRSDRLDEGFHSAAERAAADPNRTRPRRLTSLECRATPAAFAELLVSLARSARVGG